MTQRRNDPRTCPASGYVVQLDRPRKEAKCSTCGRKVTLRVGQDEFARWPTHKRLDAEIQAREACKVEQAVTLAQDAIRRRSPRARADLTRAIKLAERRSPDAGVARRIEKLSTKLVVNEERAFVRRMAKMPRDPASLVEVIMRTSDFETGAVEPDTWLDFLGGLLTSRAVFEKIAKADPRLHIRLGLEALIRELRPQTWNDLLSRNYKGTSQSFVALMNEFPALQGLRLPDAAYAMPSFDLEGVPF